MGRLSYNIYVITLHFNYYRKVIKLLYTGYFTKTKDYINAGLQPVSVAGKTPDFFIHPKWTNFAPRKPLFYKWKNGKISNEEYMLEYEEYLELNISISALQKLKQIVEEKEIVMCCYEKPSDFCHRHTLANWLSNKLSVPIGEVYV